MGALEALQVASLRQAAEVPLARQAQWPGRDVTARLRPLTREVECIWRASILSVYPK